MQRQQQQQHATATVRTQLCARAWCVYNLGLVMGQHVQIIEIYWRHRYCHAFPGPTAPRGCSCCLTATKKELLGSVALEQVGQKMHQIHSAPPDPLAGFKGPTSKGRGGGQRRGEERERGRAKGGVGEGRIGNSQRSPRSPSWI